MVGHDLTVPMISDGTHEIVREYGVVDDELYGMVEAARRSAFVLDEDGAVVYEWVRSGDNPDFDAFVADLRDEVDRGAGD